MKPKASAYPGKGLLLNGPLSPMMDARCPIHIFSPLLQDNISLFIQSLRSKIQSWIVVYLPRKLIIFIWINISMWDSLGGSRIIATLQKVLVATAVWYKKLPWYQISKRWRPLVVWGNVTTLQLHVFPSLPNSFSSLICFQSPGSKRNPRFCLCLMTWEEYNFLYPRFLYAYSSPFRHPPPYQCLGPKRKTLVPAG